MIRLLQRSLSSQSLGNLTRTTKRQNTNKCNIKRGPNKQQCTQKTILRERYDRLALWHLARKWSGSILTTPEPALGLQLGGGGGLATLHKERCYCATESHSGTHCNNLTISRATVDWPVLAVVETGLRRHRTRSVHAGTRHFSLVSKSLLNKSYLYVGMKLVKPSLKPWKTCTTRRASETEAQQRGWLFSS